MLCTICSKILLHLLFSHQWWHLFFFLTASSLDSECLPWVFGELSHLSSVYWCCTDDLWMQRWFPFCFYWYWPCHFRFSCTCYTRSPLNQYLVICSLLHYFSFHWAALAKNIPESNPGVACEQTWPARDSGGAGSHLCKRVLNPPWTYLCQRSWALPITVKLLLS